jgi:DNA primase
MTAATAAYEPLLDALRSHNHKVRQTGNQAQAQCPAHDDSNPSLSIKASTGQALIYCWGGCDTTDVLAALGLTMSDLYDNPKGAAYTYDDGRVVKKTPNKRFYQSGNTKSTPTLYNLRKVQSAVFDGRTVWLTEGEKDADAIESVGGVATTAPMGAKNFHKVDVSPLTGATVKAIVDNDDAGKEWQQQVSQKLKGVAGSLELYRAKVGKDAADHITAGYTLDEFESLSPKPVALSKARAIFKRWLGDDYDTDALDAPAAVERLDGDPVWLLIISGSGNAKTEAVRALSGIDALVVSTITSEGALLSATEKRQKAKDATGGLLREIGGRGVLVIKDFTSILSMNRDLRAQVLGASAKSTTAHGCGKSVPKAVAACHGKAA